MFVVFPNKLLLVADGPHRRRHAAASCSRSTSCASALKPAGRPRRGRRRVRSSRRGVHRQWPNGSSSLQTRTRPRAAQSAPPDASCSAPAPIGSSARRGIDVSRTATPRWPGRRIELFMQVPRIQLSTSSASRCRSAGPRARAHVHGRGDKMTAPKHFVHFQRPVRPRDDLPRWASRTCPATAASVLICDHPGIGEALRFRELFTTNSTVQSYRRSACMETSSKRTGTSTPSASASSRLSLELFHAARAAAMEPRFRSYVSRLRSRTCPSCSATISTRRRQDVGTT